VEEIKGKKIEITVPDGFVTIKPFRLPTSVNIIKLL
jgi:hypothetical protein